MIRNSRAVCNTRIWRRCELRRRRSAALSA